MTKEELKKEAEEYATKRASKLYTRNMWDRYYQTYIDSAEPREKRIAELEAQIEKMKNCFNCAKGDWNNRVKCIKSGCVNKNKWEIKEK